MRKTILFDLDGTLTDPGIGITNSVMYALERFGIAVEDRRTLYKFIGPPLLDSFRTFYGFSDAQAQAALTAYREYFGARGLFENTVYPAVPRMLETLRGAGYTLCVATSKPEEYAGQILAHFGLDGYFSLLAGNTLKEERPTKGAVIAYALKTLRLPPEAAVMVGDRAHDVIGAAENGVASVGVLYGYGSREELETAGAGRIAETVEALERLLMEGCR